MHIAEPEADSFTPSWTLARAPVFRARACLFGLLPSRFGFLSVPVVCVCAPPAVLNL